MTTDNRTCELLLWKHTLHRIHNSSGKIMPEDRQPDGGPLDHPGRFGQSKIYGLKSGWTKELFHNPLVRRIP